MTQVTRWNPFREFDDLFNQFGGFNSEGRRSAAWLPPVDITETEEAYQFEIEIPAVVAEDVSVQVKDGLLSISGERKREEQVEGRRHRVERVFGSFARSFQLPEDADDESIEAKASNGVLTLTVAKREKVTPRRIEVKVH